MSSTKHYHVNTLTLPSCLLRADGTADTGRSSGAKSPVDEEGGIVHSQEKHNMCYVYICVYTHTPSLLTQQVHTEPNKDCGIKMEKGLLRLLLWRFGILCKPKYSRYFYYVQCIGKPLLHRTVIQRKQVISAHHLPYLHDVILRHGANDPRLIGVPTKVRYLGSVSSMNKLLVIRYENKRFFLF